MIVDLNDLELQSKLIDTEIGIDEIQLAAEAAELLGPVHLRCEVVRDGFSVSVTGTIDARFEIECSRCLQAIELSPPLKFRVEFVEKEHFGSEGEHEIEAANLSADSLEGELLDLNGLVREQLLLNLPEQIFCREDCKGLCDHCGTNRNLKDCDCKIDEIDPRWSALKGLKLPTFGEN